MRGSGFFWLRRQGRPRGSFVSIPKTSRSNLGGARGWFALRDDLLRAGNFRDVSLRKATSGRFRSPGQPGERNDLSSYALRIGDRPVPVLWPRAGIRGVVFSKLSRLLNQEDALSAPCLQHFRNLLWRDKGREVWFSLGENHEKGLSLPGFPAAQRWPSVRAS